MGSEAVRVLTSFKLTVRVAYLHPRLRIEQRRFNDLPGLIVEAWHSFQRLLFLDKKVRQTLAVCVFMSIESSKLALRVIARNSLTACVGVANAEVESKELPFRSHLSARKSTPFWERRLSPGGQLIMISQVS